MKNLTKTLIATSGALALFFSSSSFAESIYIPPYLESGLIKICKTAAQDKSFMMTKTIKSFRLNHKLVALKVVCNGKDIISFAEQYGAVKTTARLSRSIGSVQVTDLASLNNSKYDVTFNF